MPIFEYECGECGRVFEVLMRGRPPERRAACPGCGSKSSRRLFSRFGFRSGGTVRTSAGGGGCSTCRPSPGQCGTCRGG